MYTPAACLTFKDHTIVTRQPKLLNTKAAQLISDNEIGSALAELPNKNAAASACGKLDAVWHQLLVGAASYQHETRLKTCHAKIKSHS